MLGTFTREFAVRRVLADGGSQLHLALLRAGLIDEMVIHYVPAIMGVPGMTLFQVAGAEGLSQPVVASPIRIDAQPDGGIIARYRVRDDGLAYREDEDV